MKRVLPLFFFFLLGWMDFTEAQILLQLDASTPIPATLQEGVSFSIALQLNNGTTVGVAGDDVDVRAVDSLNHPVSNLLSLTSVNITSPALNLPNSTFSSPLILDPQAGTASQPFDLGATNLATNQTLGQGVSNLETLTFTVLSNAPSGSYKLEFYAVHGAMLGPPTIVDNSGNPIGTATDVFYSNNFLITVPEPSTWLLGLIGSVSIVCFRLFFGQKPPGNHTIHRSVRSSGFALDSDPAFP